MLNPIIYSFTVKEFKRSALRMAVPFWQFLHRLLPFLISAPPERVMQRMSRQGHKWELSLTFFKISIELGIRPAIDPLKWQPTAVVYCRQEFVIKGDKLSLLSSG